MGEKETKRIVCVRTCGWEKVCACVRAQGCLCARRAERTRLEKIGESFQTGDSHWPVMLRSRDFNGKKVYWNSPPSHTHTHTLALSHTHTYTLSPLSLFLSHSISAFIWSFLLEIAFVKLTWKSFQNIHPRHVRKKTRVESCLETFSAFFKLSNFLQF